MPFKVTEFKEDFKRKDISKDRDAMQAFYERIFPINPNTKKATVPAQYQNALFGQYVEEQHIKEHNRRLKQLSIKFLHDSVLAPGASKDYAGGGEKIAKSKIWYRKNLYELTKALEFEVVVPQGDGASRRRVFSEVNTDSLKAKQLSGVMSTDGLLEECLKPENIKPKNIDMQEEKMGLNLDLKVHQSMQASWVIQKLLKDILNGDANRVHSPYIMDKGFGLKRAWEFTEKGDGPLGRRATPQALAAIKAKKDELCKEMGWEQDESKPGASNLLSIFLQQIESSNHTRHMLHLDEAVKGFLERLDVELSKVDEMDLEFGKVQELIGCQPQVLDLQKMAVGSRMRCILCGRKSELGHEDDGKDHCHTVGHQLRVFNGVFERNRAGEAKPSLKACDMISLYKPMKVNGRMKVWQDILTGQIAPANWEIHNKEHKHKEKAQKDFWREITQDKPVIDAFARHHGVTLRDANEALRPQKGLILIQLDSGRSMLGERWKTAVEGVAKLMRNVSDQMSKISSIEEKEFIRKNGPQVEAEKLRDWFETINDDFTEEHISAMMKLAARYAIQDKADGKTRYGVAEFCEAQRKKDLEDIDVVIMRFAWYADTVWRRPLSVPLDKEKIVRAGWMTWYEEAIK